MPDIQDALDLLSETREALHKTEALIEVLLRTNTHVSGPSDVYQSTLRFKEMLDALILEYEEALKTAKR